MLEYLGLVTLAVKGIRYIADDIEKEEERRREEEKKRKRIKRRRRILKGVFLIGSTVAAWLIL